MNRETITGDHAEDDRDLLEERDDEESDALELAETDERRSGFPEDVSDAPGDRFDAQPNGEADSAEVTQVTDVAETGEVAEVADAPDTADEQPRFDSGAPASPSEPASAGDPVLTQESADTFLDRWSDVQAGFIEDPHKSVTEADALLTDVLTAHQQAVEQRRARISAAQEDGAADTENLRLTLLEYRELIATLLPGSSNT